MEAPSVTLQPPLGEKKVLLHACCAPCSSAILETMLNNGLEPTLYFCNPNIYPLAEYDKRKAELIAYAQQLQVPFYDADDDHDLWLRETEPFKEEPEQGKRCALCFLLRLEKTARFASQNGFRLITSTLGSSRWKRLEQIIEAGSSAVAPYPGMIFWEQNWRKEGIADRRDWLVKELNFYQQDYCGCEKSLARAELRRAKAIERKSNETPTKRVDD